jgi:hypothetical protein
MPNKFVGHGPYHYAKGGEVRRELKFMEDKGAPKSMIAAEKKEHGLPAGKKFAVGGGVTEGENKGIDDPTRERAMEAVRARMAAAAAAEAEPEGAVTSPVREPPPAEVTQLPPVRRQAPPAAVQRRQAPPAAVQRRAAPQASYSNEGRTAPRQAPQTPPIEPQRAAAAEAIASAMSPERKQMMAAKQAAAAEDTQRATAAEAIASAMSPERRRMLAAKKAEADHIKAIQDSMRLSNRGFAAGGSIDGCAQRGKTRAKRG